MADLHNLLGELDNEDEPAIFDNAAAAEESSDHEDITRDEPEVPPALAEAERHQFRSVQDDASEMDEFSVGAKGNRDEVVDEEETEDVDYAMLKRFFIQELNCPELVHYNADIVGLHMELLQGQEESIEKLQEQASSARDRSSANNDGNLASLVASIYAMDADRVRFMLTDLARNRLAKIEQHALYMRGMVDRMSEDEVSYLKQYGELLERHLRRSVLDHLPKDAWKKLDSNDMIDSPDLDEFVFCKVMETVEIDNRDPEANETSDEFAADSVQEHKEGACLIARYSAIKYLVLEGKIELLM